MIGLVRAGSMPKELAKEFGSSARASRNWGSAGAGRTRHGLGQGRPDSTEREKALRPRIENGHLRDQHDLGESYVLVHSGSSAGGSTGS